VEGERAGHGQAMPGRLKMEDQSNTTGSQGLKKDRSHPSETAESYAVGSATLPQTNGIVANGTNGVLPNGAQQNDKRNGADMPRADSGPPPPLDQSWRDGPENKSLGKLMIRTAESCWIALDQVLKSMAAQPVAQQPPGPNGATSEYDNDAVSLAKKRELMDFAQLHRGRFIKAHVISDWAKDADAFAGIIDVNATLGKNNACHAAATSAVGEMKLAMNHAKMPNPNIEGALELLSTGKSHGLPDFGYITPLKMSAKALLQTLRDMNVMLATRLSLHEELPDHFNDYTIADGRATFTVPGEFAVDLAVADEDTTSPFFFIDLRFLFTPAPTQMSEQIQNICEMEVNKAIATNGLSGCYDVLHNFILTHKLNVLHSQVAEVVHGKWFESIRVERIRRLLVLSYWTKRPGRKSWIEFGIGSGRSQRTNAKQKPTPIIATRWFQRGVEVQHTELDIDWHTISLEAILLQAIARHTSSLLRHIKEDLETFVVKGSGFAVELNTSDYEPADCELTMRLPSLRTPVRCSIEPVTGQMTVSPSTPATRYAQQRLNGESTPNIPQRLASTICATALEAVDKQVSTLAWEPVVDFARQDNVRQLFGEDVWQRKVFVPSKRWGNTWAVAVTVGLGGSRWWIVQLRTADDTKLKSIVNTRRLSTPATMDAFPSRTLLLRIEKAALAEVSYTALSMELTQRQIPHHFEKPSLIGPDDSSLQSTAPAMYINFSKLMNASADRKWKPWAQELMRLTHQGDDNKSISKDSAVLFTRHDLRLALLGGTFKELRKHITSNIHDRDIAMNETGGLAIRFRTPFGVSFVDQLRTKLSAIKRLENYLAALRDCHAACLSVTLSHLTFTYGPNQNLRAHLAFPGDSQQSVKLRLEPPDSNSHLLVRKQLESNFNRDSDEAFGQTLNILLFSLPVLKTVEQLQSSHADNNSLTIHVRNVSWYSLKYTAPLSQITFQVRTRTKIDGKKHVMFWHVEQEPGKANSDSLPEDMLSSLRELWSSNDEHWIGLKNGLAAGVQGIGVVLQRIDEIVRKFEGNAKVAVQPPAVQQQQQQPLKPVVKQEVIALD
jgi:mediator of RNA polymerase II transcription subunit 14